MRFAPLAAAMVTSALVLVADLRRPCAPVSPAIADKVRRPVGRCVRFSQTLDGHELVRLRLASRCDFQVSCEMSWVVKCDGGATRGEASIVLDRGDVSTQTASA